MQPDSAVCSNTSNRRPYQLADHLSSWLAATAQMTYARSTAAAAAGLLAAAAAAAVLMGANKTGLLVTSPL
jgi:hypothetical protein